MKEFKLAAKKQFDTDIDVGNKITLTGINKGKKIVKYCGACGRKAPSEHWNECGHCMRPLRYYTEKD